MQKNKASDKLSQEAENFQCLDKRVNECLWYKPLEIISHRFSAFKDDATW